jgi:hypothetical protein
MRVQIGTVNLGLGSSTFHSSARVITQPNIPSFVALGLVQTATPMVFNTNVGAIGIASNRLGSGVNMIMTGWGGTVGTTRLLQQFTTTSITNADCRNRIPGLNVNELHVCSATSGSQG